MYNNHKSVVDQITWAASSDKQIELPNEGAITRIVLTAEFTVTAVLAASTNTQLCQYKPFENIKIEGGGGKNYFSMNYQQMGRMLHLLNRYDFRGLAPHPAVGTNTVYSSLIMHFGSLPILNGRDNPFDLTAFIPARDEPNLRLTITTTQAADICDTAIDITAGTIKATVYQVVGKPSMSGMVPISSTQQFDTLGAAQSDLSKQFDVPTGSHLRRIVIMTQEATAITSGGPLLANDIVSKIGLLLPKTSQRLIEVDDEALAAVCGVLADGYDVGSAADCNKVEGYQFPGFYVIDGKQFGNSKLYGLDLTNFQTGDAKLAFTIPSGTTGDDIIIWYDTVQPYNGRT